MTKTTAKQTKTPMPRRKAGEKRRHIVTSNPAINPKTGKPYPGQTTMAEVKARNPNRELVGDTGAERQMRIDRQAEMVKAEKAKKK